MGTIEIQRTVAVTDEVTSPELVLVAPPEIAAQAREALPDYEFDLPSALYSRLAAGTEAALRAATPGPERIDSNLELTPGQPLPSYELERKWPWYDLEPKPLDTLPKRRTARVFAFVFLAMVLLPVALVLLIRYL